MKKFFHIIFSMIIIFTLANTYVYAENEITVKLNGTKIPFDQSPIIRNDRTLVPMRAIFEAMGCEVEWDRENQRITATKDNFVIEMMIGYETMRVTDYSNGSAYEHTLSVDVPPQIVNDRTLVPLRAISESMGADVDWNGLTHTVTITYNETLSNNPYINVCPHANTMEVVMIDDRTFVDTGSALTHEVTDTMGTYCEDCREYIREYKKVSEQNHTFEKNVCTECGYKRSTDSNGNSEYTELRNAELFNQYGDSSSSNCQISAKTLGFTINVSKRANSNLNVGDKTKMCAEYNLDGKYNRLTAKIKGSLNAAYMNIYADDKLVVKTELMVGEKDIDINLSGVKILKFEAYDNVSATLYGAYSKIYIYDCKLWY